MNITNLQVGTNNNINIYDFVDSQLRKVICYDNESGPRGRFGISDTGTAIAITEYNDFSLGVGQTYDQDVFGTSDILNIFDDDTNGGVKLTTYDLSDNIGYHTLANFNSVYANHINYTFLGYEYETDTDPDFYRDYIINKTESNGSEYTNTIGTRRWVNNTLVENEISLILDLGDPDVNLSDPIPWRKALEISNIGKRYSLLAPSAASRASGSIFNVGTIKVPPGVSLVRVAAEFSSNATGYRQVFISNSATGSYADRYRVAYEKAATGRSTSIAFTCILGNYGTTDQTQYVNIRHNAGTNLTVTVGAEVIPLLDVVQLLPVDET